MTRFALLTAAVMALAVPAAAQAKDTHFRTPSGNIGCRFTDAPQYLRCDILQTSDAPPKPRSCDLDYGYAYALNRRGRTHVLCAGDTVIRRSAPVFRYGRTKHLGNMTCESKRTGLLCFNLAGHGFILSRARIRRF
jgi:Family of unknown function (DUF6636)